MRSNDNISWMVPFTIHFAEARRELLKIFPLVALLRIILAMVIVFVVAFFVFRYYMPDLEFDWTGAFLECAGFLLLILCMCCVITLIPATLAVSARGILVSQGQLNRLHRFEDLAECYIQENKGPFPLLAFRRRDQSRLFEFAISPKVSLNDLRTMLGKHTGRNAQKGRSR